MKDYFFILEYGQWLILVLSILALYLVSSVQHKTRLKGYLMTALSRFSGAIIFLFVDLFAFVIANLIQTYIAIRGYFQNKKAVEGSSKNSENSSEDNGEPLGFVSLYAISKELKKTSRGI